LCSRANWRVRMQELDRQFQYPERERDSWVVNNNIIRRQIATCCTSKQDASTTSKKKLWNTEIQNKSAKLAKTNKHTRLRSFHYSYSCCSHKSFLSHLPHFNLVHCFFYLSCARAVVVVSLASPRLTYIFHRPNYFILMSSLKHTCVIAVCLVALSYWRVLCSAPHRFPAHDKKKYRFGINHIHIILRAHK
jgi:hypothetical protein